MTTVSHEVVQALVKLFNERFDGNELESLAFALGVNYEDIDGNTRSAKARELAQFLNRRGMMDKLRRIGPIERPDLDWEMVFGGALTPTPPLVTGVSGMELAAAAQVVARLPDFADPVDRRGMLRAAGVLPFAAGIDLNGAERTVSLRVLSQLSDVSTTADSRTPLGDFLRYVLTIPEALPNRTQIEELISKHRL
jgi:hypothetical protein